MDIDLQKKVEQTLADNTLPPGYTYEWNYKASPKEYTPAALRRAGVR